MAGSDYHKENSRIAWNTLIIYVRMISLMLIGVFSARFVFKALGQSDYGLYNVVAGLIAMLGFISTAMGTTTRRYINIEMGRPGGDPNKVFNILMRVHIVLAVLILLLAETVGMWYVLHFLKVEAGKLPDAIFVFQISTIVACIGIINLPYQSLIEANEKFIISSSIDISTNLVKLLLVFLLVFYGGNALRLYAVFIALVSLLSFVCYSSFCRKLWPSAIRLRRVKDQSQSREIVSFNNYTALSALAYIARTQGSNLIVNYFFGTFVNGALSVAYQMENFAVTSMNRISSTASPQITQNYGAGQMDRSLDLLNKISRFSALLMTLMAFCAVAELEFVLKLWLDTVPVGAVSFCRWTLASALVRSFCVGTQIYEQATGKIKWFQIVNSTLSLMCLPLGWIAFRYGAPPFTIIAIYICYSFVYRAVEFVLMHSLLRFDVWTYLRKAYLRPFLLVVLMTVYLVLYSQLMPSDAGAILRILGIGITFAVCAAGVFFIGMFPYERKSALALLQETINNKKK